MRSVWGRCWEGGGVAAAVVGYQVPNTATALRAHHAQEEGDPEMPEIDPDETVPGGTALEPAH